MRLTAHLVSTSPQFVNTVREWELDCRGNNYYRFAAWNRLAARLGFAVRCIVLSDTLISALFSAKIDTRRREPDSTHREPRVDR